MTWEKGSMPILGEEILTKTGKVKLDDLIYFKENPRVYSVLRSDGQEPSQTDIQEQLWKMQHVRELVNDIESNGGLIDAIIVRDKTMEVLEGNSRLSAYRKLREKNPLDLKWGEIKCTILPSTITDAQVFSLLGQYHITGKKDWTPYEQAGFLYRRHNLHKIPVSQLAKELGQGSRKITQKIDAFKLMIENKDNNEKKWSYYETIVGSNNLNKLMKDHSDLKGVLLKEVKENKIKKAADIRDKLAKIPIKKPKIIKAYVKGEVDIDGAYNRAEASGSTNAALLRINQFREWISSTDVDDAIKNAPDNVQRKLKLEIKRLEQKIKLLRSGM